MLDKDDQFIKLNAKHNIETQLDDMKNQHSAKVVLLGDFTEQKDDNHNTLLTGQVKNIGLSVWLLSMFRYPNRKL